MPKIVPDLASAPAPLAPYSVATEANGFIFISGQVGIDPSGGHTPDDVSDQAQLVMSNIQRIVTDLGLALDDIVKTTIFLADIGDFAAVNQVYGSFFQGPPPARSTIQAGALPAPQFRVEIEAIVAR